jgi:transcriptional regulator with GAF, ATPase, and Fis domain
VEDLNSRNGTHVNGRRVTAQAVGHGDVLRFGDTLFKLVGEQASRYAPFSLDGKVTGDAELPEGMVGGLKLSELAREVKSIAASKTVVLVYGETGAGKEGIARALHSSSGRAGPFRAVNCAAIPAQLVESELFGHEKGAFTGATRAAPGLFRAADGGTLLLDEIGDMPLDAQAKLLRVLDRGEVVPVGGYEPVQIDVRIVAATHRDLRAAVGSGAFRADLYARLDGFMMRVPPLRDRIEDVPLLVRHFLERERAKAQPTFAFMCALVLYDWPFNVRELAAAVSRAVAVAAGKPLEVEHLPEVVRENLRRRTEGLASPAAADTPGAPERKPRPSQEELERLLLEAHGNIAAVARALNRDRALVSRWLKDAQVDPERFR